MKKRKSSGMNLQTGVVSSLVGSIIASVVATAVSQRREDAMRKDAWEALTRSDADKDPISPTMLMNSIATAIEFQSETVEKLEENSQCLTKAHRVLVEQVDDVERRVNDLCGSMESAEELKSRLREIDAWAKEVCEQIADNEGKEVEAIAFEKNGVLSQSKVFMPGRENPNHAAPRPRANWKQK